MAEPTGIPLFDESPSPQEPAPKAKVNARKVIDKIYLHAKWLLLEAYSASVQEWVGEVYISLSAVKTYDGIDVIWHIGKPQVGKFLHATNDTQTAIKILQELI